MTQNDAQNAYLIDALQWHLDHGADEMLEDQPIDRTAPVAVADLKDKLEQAPVLDKNVMNNKQAPIAENMMGAAQAIIEAQKLADNCETLEQLSEAIQGFDGLSVKKTASNMVFSDGNPQAKIMLIGEAPATDEDRQGTPFVGAAGQLLDKILASIGLGRDVEEAAKAVYISNILNWRPPGNRTPTPSELEISLPFIRKHIELAQPDRLILCGGVGAKALLQKEESISKLRGKFHDYKINESLTIPALVTYHPSYLLSTPAQKKAVWMDMLMLQAELNK